MNETKSYEKRNKIDKPLVRLTKENGRRLKIVKLGMEEGPLILMTEFKKVIRENHEQMYAKN